MAAMNPSNQQASTAVPLRAAMNPMLLALACAGSRKELEEACLREPSLLEGVTVEGDTALHAVASYGDSTNFLKSADFIFGKAKDLLFVRNNNRDTPLHCAARAGSPHMIYRLIGFAKCVGRAKELLEMENKLGETALHEAVRIRSDGIVKQLMEEDPELASIPRDGASPLYLAVLFEDKTIAETLYAKSAAGMLSYSGPNGQNALHAGVLRGEVMTEMLLNWKKDLAKQADQMGSTPLHIAASLTGVGGWHSGVPIKPLVHADPYQLYQPDHEGSFPIHIAAASGLYSTIKTMITEYPETAGLRDSKGRTFIHVAAEWKRDYFITHACCTPSLAWILNMQDKDGNTALHLAVQLRVFDSFCSLLMNKTVRLDLTNNNGETPLDLTWSKIPASGYSYQWVIHRPFLLLVLGIFP
ncbi:protein ACCELERATED CELL DEATH 6-like [Aegilops tauschii subsp. strangulata]|uniref:protein ACCELERATED CELL DEATH 6-like n=1 Tax=Aegilops tauschii subsp. strangulata TaxID=200361 RepID=UPI001ABC9B41|nr:protein ACCELERATED CELL DEATH 6-like [Aegilops tauschii subsp. strangulata]